MIRCAAFTLFLLLVSAVVVHADSLPADPKMVVNDPTCEESCITPILETMFTFMSNGNGGGFLTFQNESNVNWTTLLIKTGNIPFPVPADTITCQSNAFQTCQVVDVGGGVTAMFLSGLNSEEGFNGIPNGIVFTINLNDDIDGVPNFNPNGSGGWGANRAFFATANVTGVVPEPASLTLLGLGMCALAAKYKLRGRRRARN